MTLFDGAHTSFAHTSSIEDGPGRAAAPLSRTPPRCTRYNSPPFNGQYTNFILFDVAL